MATLTIFGAGSWGTAIAHTAAGAGHDVALWCRRDALARQINNTGRNTDYLPDMTISPRVQATSDVAEAARFSPFWVLALPTQMIRAFLPAAAPFVTERTTLCNVAKGIEIATTKRISEIASELLPSTPYSVLSGPSFAEEVVRGLPTVVSVASEDNQSAALWQRLLSTPRFRIYTSADVTGTEIGGAVKNIMAIASGMGAALGLGDNGRAGLVSRGLAEIMRLGEPLGAHPLTFAGLAGMGDLVLTCYSTKSRNYRLGFAMGEGRSLSEAEEAVGQVSEGAYTVRAVVRLAQKLGVELPIAQAIHRLLYENSSPEEELERLMGRGLKAEYPPSILWGNQRCPEGESKL